MLLRPRNGLRGLHEQPVVPCECKSICWGKAQILLGAHSADLLVRSNMQKPRSHMNRRILANVQGSYVRLSKKTLNMPPAGQNNTR